MRRRLHGPFGPTLLVILLALVPLAPAPAAAATYSIAPGGPPVTVVIGAVDENATVTFNAVAPESGNAAVPAKIYVGKYEDRAVPIADTDSTTTLVNTAKFVPGTYDFVVQAPGYGLSRFTETFTAAATTVTFKLQTNWASSAKGAAISGDGTAAELA